MVNLIGWRRRWCMQVVIGKDTFALAIASKNGNLGIVRLLIEAGVSTILEAGGTPQCFAYFCYLNAQKIPS